MKIASKIKRLGWLVGLPVLILTGCGGYETGTSYNMESGGGVEFSNEHSSADQLGVGDIMYLNFDESGMTYVDFSGVSSDAEFFLVVGSASESGASTSFQMSGNISVPTDLDENLSLSEKEIDASEILSAWLRAAEFDLSVTEPTPRNDIGMKASFSLKAASVGDVESFRVLSNLSSTNIYTLVDGEVRCIGEEVIFYVDPRVSPDILNDEEIVELCDGFDNVVREEQELFGEMSDIDDDRRIAVLMTPQINRLGSLGGGIITGYFWAGDLYSQSSSNPVSNEREMIYTMVPDPNGVYGAKISKDFALDSLLPAVLPHELQHAISYNQHVFVKGSTPEENWLNEGLSHLAEDLTGFGQENPSRYSLYLSSTPQGGLVTHGQPNLLERGAAYLFLRYLYEQASNGSSFLKNLVSSSSIGVSNLEKAFAGSSGFSQFHEFMARWSVALALTNKGITSDPRFVYRTRVIDSDTGNWKGVCLDCDADDNRGTILSGVSMSNFGGSQSITVNGSAMKFYDLSYVPDRITIDGGNASFGVLIRKM